MEGTTVKKIYALLLALLHLFLAISSASAVKWDLKELQKFFAGNNDEGWNQYVIDEVQLQISIPQKYYVLTQGMDPDDPTLKILGRTPADVDAELNSSSTYLLATSYGGDQFIVVTTGQVAVKSLNLFNEEQLDVFLRVYEQYWEQSGIKIKEKKLLSVNDRHYACYVGTQTGSGFTGYHISYNTIENNNLYIFDFFTVQESYLQDFKRIENDFLSRIHIQEH